MDRDEVIAFRESDKIDGFLAAIVAQGKMTEFERQTVQQEAHEVSRHAGYLDQNGRLISTGGDESAAVERQSNHQRKRKIIELHPELEGEMKRFIEHRPHHPLPPIPPALAKPGAALKQYHALVAYIDEKRNQGVIKHEESHAMYEPAIAVFNDSGVDYCGDLSELTDKAVLVQAHHLMKKKLLEIHPELADEVRNSASPRSR